MELSKTLIWVFHCIFMKLSTLLLATCMGFQSDFNAKKPSSFRSLATATATPTTTWSELQTDLLESILKRLELVDIVCFRAVCSSWNKIARSYTSSPSYTLLPQIPWLMAPADPLDGFYARPFINDISAGTTRVYKLKDVDLLVDSKVRFVGSSHGWLAFLDQFTRSVELVNPFTGVQIPLLMTNKIMHGANQIRKLVLSADPSINKDDFSVAALYGNWQRLAFYKHGVDKKKPWTWTRRLKGQSYQHIECHKGQIFALSTFASKVDVWNFHTSVPARVVHFKNLDMITMQYLDTITNPLPVNPRYWWWKIDTYLVESSNELLIVRELCGNHRDELSSKVAFMVCRLDEDGEEGCIPLHTLSGRALFMGMKGGISISTRDFPGLKENSIYFRHDRHLEILDLEEKKISRCSDDLYGLDYMRSFFWIVPNIN